MNKDKLKQAFIRIKEDIFNLQSQISSLTREIQELKRTLKQTRPEENQTDTQKIQTDNYPSQALEPSNFEVSTGNQGVQTDRQTIRQTDRHMGKFALSSINKDPLAKIQKVSEVLNSLDEIKKDLRTRFKKITPQEMIIFSAIYQLEDQGRVPDYFSISSKTNLSESSIRDYVQKLIKKGIPIEKTKENNKKVTLSISRDFKKIASLSTIISLREL